MAAAAGSFEVNVSVPGASKIRIRQKYKKYFAFIGPKIRSQQRRECSSDSCEITLLHGTSGGKEWRDSITIHADFWTGANKITKNWSTRITEDTDLVFDCPECRLSNLNFSLREKGNLPRGVFAQVNAVKTARSQQMENDGPRISIAPAMGPQVMTFSDPHGILVEEATDEEKQDVADKVNDAVETNDVVELDDNTAKIIAEIEDDAVGIWSYVPPAAHPYVVPAGGAAAGALLSRWLLRGSLGWGAVVGGAAAWAWEQWNARKHAEEVIAVEAAEVEIAATELPGGQSLNPPSTPADMHADMNG